MPLRIVALAVLSAILLGVMWRVEMDSVLIAVLVGALVWAATLIRPVLGKIGTTVCIALILIGPWLAVPIGPKFVADLPTSMLHRLLIWEFTQEKVLERPILGWGLDSARAIPGGKAKVPPLLNGVDISTAPTWPAIVASKAERLPLHPHNIGLQITLELGIIGLGLATTLLACFLKWIFSARITRTSLATSLAAITSGLVISAGSFGAWQTWWLTALILGAAYILLSVKNDESNSN